MELDGQGVNGERRSEAGGYRRTKSSLEALVIQQTTSETRRRDQHSSLVRGRGWSPPAHRIRSMRASQAVEQ